MTRASSRVACALAALAACFVFGASGADAVAVDGDPPCEELLPLQLRDPPNSAEVELGQRLFFDEILSKPGEKRRLSCYSCHQFKHGGATPNPKDQKIDDTFTDNNSPSIITSTFNHRQRWKGNKETLHDVIAVPLTNLMNEPATKDERRTWAGVLARLESSDEYKAAFTSVYRTSRIAEEQVKNALVAYMDALAYPAKIEFASRFDRYCRDHKDALSVEEREGFRLFREYGCVACHQGQNIGGNMMAPRHAFEANLQARYDDPEKKCPAGQKCDTWWKVPSLRNVGETAPYFHDGSEPSLREAIKTMAREQLGQESMSDEDAAKIEAFLRTLTSAPDPTLLSAPTEMRDGGGW